MSGDVASTAARDRFDLTGSVIWVPGGAGALGSVVSRGLAEHGAHVILAGRDAERTEARAKHIRSLGLSAEARVLDVTDEEAVDAQAAAIVDDHGHLDACVNLAYRSTGKTIDVMTSAEWLEGLQATALGAFLVGRAAGRVLSDGGSLVQFSSMYGVVSPDPRAYPESQSINPPDYGFAKAGVLQLVRYQAVQLASRNVRVNAVVPGAFPGEKPRADAEFIERLSSRAPLGRVGDPEELVGAVVFLCSRASTFVTGTSITVDGGWTAW